MCEQPCRKCKTQLDHDKQWEKDKAADKADDNLDRLFENNRIVQCPSCNRVTFHEGACAQECCGNCPTYFCYSCGNQYFKLTQQQRRMQKALDKALRSGEVEKGSQFATGLQTQVDNWVRNHPLHRYKDRWAIHTFMGRNGNACKARVYAHLGTNYN